MRQQQDIIYQGIKYSLDIDVTALPEAGGLVWCAALYNRAHNARYLGTRDAIASTSTNVHFDWSDGFEEVSGKLVLTDDKNSTARMNVGTVDLELFLSDRSVIARYENYGMVVKSNVMALNINQDIESESET